MCCPSRGCGLIPGFGADPRAMRSHRVALGCVQPGETSHYDSSLPTTPITGLDGCLSARRRADRNCILTSILRRQSYDAGAGLRERQWLRCPRARVPAPGRIGRQLQPGAINSRLRFAGQMRAARRGWRPVQGLYRYDLARNPPTSRGYRGFRDPSLPSAEATIHLGPPIDLLCELLPRVCVAARHRSHGSINSARGLALVRVEYSAGPS